MTHAEALAQTAAYHAGTLDRDRVRAFHAHLKACEACQAGMRTRGAQLRFRQAGEKRFAPDEGLRQKMAQNRRRLYQWVFLGLGLLLLFRVLSQR